MISAEIETGRLAPSCRDAAPDEILSFMSTARAIRTPTTTCTPAEVFLARVEARALLYANGEIALDEVCPLDDEYAGLTPSFAQVCREADQTAGKTQQVKPVCPALSTIQVAQWLIQQNNAARFHRWLVSHSARERAAILEHINKKQATP